MVGEPPPQAAIKHWRAFGPAEWRHVREGVVGLALGSLLPVGLFYAAYRLWSFTAAVVVVLTWSVLIFVWHRRRTGGADVFSATTFVFACVKAAAGLLSQNAQLYLAWPSLENLIYGAAFLGSAMAGRPLLALYAQRLYPVPLAVRGSATFRRAFVITSFVWLIGSVVRALVRVWLLLSLPLELYLIADTVSGWPINSLLVGFAAWYPLRRLRQAGLMSLAGATPVDVQQVELLVEETAPGPGMSLERELKLQPREPDLLDRLAVLDRLGPFEVVGRHTEQQRNSFFDTHTHALAAARLALRRRCRPGLKLAIWTIKAEGVLVRGIASRPEVEVQLRADVPPLMALGALTQAARERGASALAEAVADALAGSAPVVADPYLESDTLRRVRDLRDARGSAELELALDQVQLVGHPEYTEREIEVELRRGPESALEEARAAIAAVGAVQAGRGSKLSRALDHVRQQPCVCRRGEPVVDPVPNKKPRGD